MRIVAIVAGLTLGACAQQQPTASWSYNEILKSCGGPAKPFVETWPCVQVGMSHLDLYADVQAVYTATGNFVVEQVKEGKMTDAEAKLVMAQARQKAYETSAAREARDADREAARKAAIVGAWMNRPQPQPVVAQPIYTPSRPVNCYRVGDAVQCY